MEILLENIQPHNGLVEKCSVTQIITPASTPLLCHCPLAKPKEISSLLFIYHIWGSHQPIEGEVMTSQ